MKQNKSINDQFSIRVTTFNNAARWMTDPNLMQEVLSEVPNLHKDKNRCLDLCCGTGIVGKALKEIGFEVTGIDVTEAMVEESNKFYPSTVGAIESMPFNDNSFDLAVLRQSFKLVDGPKALKEIHRILKPEGSFILVQSVAFSNEDDHHYRLVQNARHINMLNYYSHEEFLQALKENSLEVKNFKNVTVRESVDHWLNNALALSDDLKQKIRKLVLNAPESYKLARDVKLENDELFENWNWVIYHGIKKS